MTVAVCVVVAFMLVYYRFAGLVANIALILNVLLTVAFMVMFNAAFTLSGLAGLALTVGMAVDANVLIYERMREEMSRGATLRMAIRNGFDRASITIIDANVTTLITAIVLYTIGTDQIKASPSRSPSLVLETCSPPSPCRDCCSKRPNGPA